MKKKKVEAWSAGEGSELGPESVEDLATVTELRMNEFLSIVSSGERHTSNRDWLLETICPAAIGGHFGCAAHGAESASSNSNVGHKRSLLWRVRSQSNSTVSPTPPPACPLQQSGGRRTRGPSMFARVLRARPDG